MNLRHLGLIGHPAAFSTAQHIVAPAPRQRQPPTAAESAHVTKLLAALLNVEDSARFLEATPQFSGQLREEVRAVRKAGARVNQRMLAEGHDELNTAVDTLNRRGNLLNRLALLLNSCPDEVAEDAANALAAVITHWAYPPKPRPARRRKDSPAALAA